MMYPFMTLNDDTEITHFEIIRSAAHLIIRFARGGGFENAPNI